MSVINECRVPGLEMGLCVICFSFFTKIIFKLTIDISMLQMKVEVKYFIKSMIYQKLKFFL